ncbi:MAG: TlpA disulfide reductase family protein [Gemmatimonadota bacterium]
MNIRRVFFAVASLSVVIVLLALLLQPAAPAPGAVGQAAPPFHAVTLAGETRSLDDYRGQVVLLNVWATWCPPCLQEMPSMQALHAELSGRGLRIVAVSVDDPGSERVIADFVRDQKLTFDILHDPASAILEQYRMTGLPETFLISRDGRILLRRYVADWMAPENRAAVEAAL